MSYLPNKLLQNNNSHLRQLIPTYANLHSTYAEPRALAMRATPRS